MRILIVSNDVVPGMGLPVAAPGLRAWGLADGLRAHGHDVALTVNRGPVDRTWKGMVPPPTPPSVAIVGGRHLEGTIRTSGADAVVLINSNHADAVPSDGERLVVYDFFAPKMLELACSEPDGWPRERLRVLRERKIRGLCRADAVIVNGTKKVPYVYGWLGQCDRDIRDVPVDVVWMTVPPMTPTEPSDRLRLTLSGYLQPWSRPGAWMGPLLAALDSHEVDIDVLVAEHWGGGGQQGRLLTPYRRLFDHERATVHPVKEFDEYREFLNGSDVAVDLFAWNLEREYATVTRTVVALACGVAVIHPPFTEVAPLIADHDAGWLVDPDDTEALGRLLGRLRHDPDTVAAKRRNAARLGAEVFAPEAATRPLHARLSELAS